MPSKEQFHHAISTHTSWYKNFTVGVMHLPLHHCTYHCISPLRDVVSFECHLVQKHDLGLIQPEDRFLKSSSSSCCSSWLIGVPCSLVSALDPGMVKNHVSISVQDGTVWDKIIIPVWLPTTMATVEAPALRSFCTCLGKKNAHDTVSQCHLRWWPECFRVFVNTFKITFATVFWLNPSDLLILLYLCPLLYKKCLKSPDNTLSRVVPLSELNLMVIKYLSTLKRGWTDYSYLSFMVQQTMIYWSITLN